MFWARRWLPEYLASVTDVGIRLKSWGNRSGCSRRGHGGAGPGGLWIVVLPSDARYRLGGEARQRVQANYEIGLVTRLYEASYEALLV